MTISNEMKNLEKVQTRLVKFCKYLDKQKKTDITNNYNELYIKIESIVGTIEDALNLEETK